MIEAKNAADNNANGSHAAVSSQDRNSAAVSQAASQDTTSASVEGSRGAADPRVQNSWVQEAAVALLEGGVPCAALWLPPCSVPVPSLVVGYTSGERLLVTCLEFCAMIRSTLSQSSS